MYQPLEARKATSCFMHACVERYLELCQSKFPKALQTVEAPFLDESKPEFDEIPVNPEFDKLVDQRDDIEVISAKPGVLSDAAAQVLMKILYGARMGRYDLIRPVQALASRITKWNQLCDKKLHRLVSYINSTIELHLYGWVGDRSDMIEVVTYCDADFAGDRTDAKSTSGVLVCLVAPRTYLPITAVSKKQTSVSKSTPEAEIVALDHGISKEAMMLAALWHFAIGRGSSDSIVCKCKIKYDASIPQPISVLEGNEAACRIIVTGNNPNMRHMSRTQRVDIAWLNEYNDKIFRFVARPSDPPAAPALPPIREVRTESDPESKFNAFIKDAMLIECRASINEVRASENDSLTIVPPSYHSCPLGAGAESFNSISMRRDRYVSWDKRKKPFSALFLLARIPAKGIGPRSGSFVRSAMRLLLPPLLLP